MSTNLQNPSAAALSARSPLVVTGLNHFFGHGEARFQVLHDIDLTIARGELTILMGPSGSGKTTLLTLMGCLRNIQEGSVNLLSHELRGTNVQTQTVLRRQLGFIFQAHNLHESLTALQNVRIGLEVHGTGDAHIYNRASAHLLNMLGLRDRTDYLPENLSGGQKQRVAIARAFVSNPAVIFADEPTAALDKQSGMLVVGLLKRLGSARGTTTVMVTHDERILEMADRIITLVDGRIVSS